MERIIPSAQGMLRRNAKSTEWAGYTSLTEVVRTIIRTVRAKLGDKAKITTDPEHPYVVTVTYKSDSTTRRLSASPARRRSGAAGRSGWATTTKTRSRRR